MHYMQSVTQCVQRMNTLCFPCMSKFTPIIGLDYIRRIAEVNNGTLHKIYCTVAAVFLVSINEALS